MYSEAAKKKESKLIKKPQSSIISKKLTWNKSAVTELDPDNNSMTLSDGTKHTYEYLVLSPGLVLRWDRIEGSKEALDDP